MNKRRNFHLILGIILITTGIIVSTPILERAFLMAFLALLFFTYILFNSDFRSYKKNSTLVIASSLYILIILLYRYVGISSLEWKNYPELIAFFLMPIIMLQLPNRMSRRRVLWIWFLLVAFFSANIVYNIYLCIKHPGLNTNYVRSLMNEDYLASLNVGSSRFYTLSLIFFNLCYFVFLNGKQKKVRLLMLCCSLLSAIYIIGFCFKAAVVVYLTISFILLSLAKKNIHLSSLLIVGVTFLCLFLLVKNLFMDDLVNFIVSYSPNERLTGRMIALIDDKNVAAFDTSFEERKALWLVSLDTWLYSPQNLFFGIGSHISQFGSANSGISHHSAFLDVAAKYGLLGVVTMFILLKSSFSFIISVFNQEYRMQIIVIFTILIMLGFTKDFFFPSIGCIVFFMLPLSTIFLGNKKNRTINNNS